MEMQATNEASTCASTVVSGSTDEPGCDGNSGRSNIRTKLGTGHRQSQSGKGTVDEVVMHPALWTSLGAWPTLTAQLTR